MKAYDLVKRGWCQGRDAVDSDGCIVPCTSPDAVKFCMYGAIRAAYPEYEARALIINLIVPKIRQYSIIGWNDRPGQTQEEVVAMLQSVEDQPL